MEWYFEIRYSFIHMNQPEKDEKKQINRLLLHRDCNKLLYLELFVQYIETA